MLDPLAHDSFRKEKLNKKKSLNEKYNKQAIKHKSIDLIY